MKPTQWAALMTLTMTLSSTAVTRMSWAQSAKPAPSATPPPAATEAVLEEAKRRYGQGIRFYQDGDYRLAANEFERAYKLSNSYKILYNIGQVHLQLNNYARAVDSLERYLVEGGSEIPEARRREIERDIKNYQSRTARLTVEANVAGADVLVDDIPVGVTPIGRPLRLEVGTHRLTISKEKLVPASKLVSLAASEEAKIVVELKEESRPSVVVVNNVGASANAKKPYLWVPWAATGALAAGTLVSGLIASQQLNDLSNLRDSSTATRAKLDNAERQASTAAIVTDILGASTVAAAGLSLYLTFRKSPAETKAAPLPAGPTLSLRGGFSHVALQGTFLTISLGLLPGPLGRPSIKHLRISYAHRSFVFFSLSASPRRLFCYRRFQ